MFRKPLAVAGITLLAVLSLTACGQDQQKSCDQPSVAANAQGLFASVDIPEKGGGGGGHGGGSGHGSSGGHAAEGGSSGEGHATSGEAHPEVPHPATAPEKLPTPQSDASHPGYVTYPGWPGYYRPGTYPAGYSRYYDCKEAGN